VLRFARKLDLAVTHIGDVRCEHNRMAITSPLPRCDMRVPTRWSDAMRMLAASWA
jgi:hypothetical protein